METPLEQTSLERSELQEVLKNSAKCFALSDFADALQHLNKLARKRSTHKAVRPKEEELASSSCSVPGSGEPCEVNVL